VTSAPEIHISCDTSRGPSVDVGSCAGKLFGVSPAAVVAVVEELRTVVDVVLVLVVLVLLVLVLVLVLVDEDVLLDVLLLVVEDEVLEVLLLVDDDVLLEDVLDVDDVVVDSTNSASVVEVVVDSTYSGSVVEVVVDSTNSGSVVGTVVSSGADVVVVAPSAVTSKNTSMGTGRDGSLSMQKPEPRVWPTGHVGGTSQSTVCSAPKL
jgi:hypothetical protein